LIIDNKVIPRDEEKLRAEFDTTHYISKNEEKMLLSKNPEIIIIGTGVSGALKTFPEFETKIKKAGIKLIKARTPIAKNKFNELNKNKRVNALIHTTC